MWTPYYAIGELSAAKGCDLLNAASWKKKNKPVFTMTDPSWKKTPDARTASAPGVYAPGYPFIIPSPDGTEYFLVYMAGTSWETPTGPIRAPYACRKSDSRRREPPNWAPRNRSAKRLKNRPA